jgi:hypothetical protein
LDPSPGTSSSLFIARSRAGVEEDVLFTLWSPKGGSGTSVLAAACALTLARSSRPHSGSASSGELFVRLADLEGDQPAVLGLPAEPSTGLADWLAAGLEAPIDALDRLAIDVATGVTLVPRGSAPVMLAPPVAAECGAALAVALRDGPVPTIVDAGRADTPASRALLEVSDVAFVVVRPCYLALRRAVRSAVLGRASGVVLVDEPQRALSAKDVSDVLDLPVVARIPWRATIARLVDSGALTRRVPEALARASMSTLRAAGVTSTRRGEAT